MESPLPYDDQDDETESQFDQLLEAIFIIDANSSEEEIRASSERGSREVTNKPILARIIHQDIFVEDASLLSAVCAHYPNELFHYAIKFLIEANPSALLWQSHLGGLIIHDIAYHPSHCVLMPWIATNYQCVLDHEIHEYPPAFRLLEHYARRDFFTTGGCTAAIIRQFFEAYHRGLTQEDSGEGECNPLHYILEGSV